MDQGVKKEVPCGSQGFTRLSEFGTSGSNAIVFGKLGLSSATKDDDLEAVATDYCTIFGTFQ